jgi:hypothetical protein
MQNFLDLDSKITAWNSKELKTSTMGHNIISDWTPAEKKRHTGLKKPAKSLLSDYLGSYHEVSLTATALT